MSETFVLALRILLAAALYAFLGVALFTIWEDLRISGLQVLSRKPPGIILTVEDNPGSPQVFSTPIITIGRDPNCELPIADETVSAHHARLKHHHNHWWLEDLRSTNGTFLNNERVEVPTVILAGDEARVGRVAITLQIEEKSSENI